MNEIKKGIDAGLSDMRASADFLNRADPEEKRRKKYGGWHHSAVAVILCCLLFGTAVFGAVTLFHLRISVNDEVIPKLDPMSAIEVKSVEGEPNEDGYLQKSYSGLDKLEEELGVAVLTSPMAEGNPYVKVWYERLGDTCHTIHLDDYIMGDLEDIRPVTQEEWDSLDASVEWNDGSYIWSKGSEYKSPVNMKIQILSDPEQEEISMDYMGYYEYVKTITSKQGFKVNILQDSLEKADLPKGEWEQIEDWYVPRVEAVFVANGMFYTLSGMVGIETMENIINSLEFG